MKRGRDEMHTKCDGTHTKCDNDVPLPMLGAFETRYATIVITQHNQARLSFITLQLCVGRVWPPHLRAYTGLPRDVRKLIWEFVQADVQRALVVLRNDAIAHISNPKHKFAYKMSSFWPGNGLDAMKIFRDCVCASYTLPSLCIFADNMYEEYPPEVSEYILDKEHDDRAKGDRIMLLYAVMESIWIQSTGQNAHAKRFIIPARLFRNFPDNALRRILHIEQQGGYYQNHDIWCVGDVVYPWCVSYSLPGTPLIRDLGIYSVKQRLKSGVYVLRPIDIERGAYMQCDIFGFSFKLSGLDLIRFYSEKDHAHYMKDLHMYNV